MIDMFFYISGVAVWVLLISDLLLYIYDMKYLEGKKTYFICLAMLVYVGLGYALGQGLNTELLLEALAIAGLRNGLK